MKKIFFILAITALFASCNDDFLEKAPLDKLSETAVFNNPDLAESYVNALYTVLSDPFQEGNVGSISDESYFRYGGSATRYRYDGRLTPDNVMYIEEGGMAHNTRCTTLNIWRRAFEYIYRMNTYIKYMTETGSEMDKESFDRLLGEVYYLRAWAYYNLIQRYSGVPIIKTPHDLASGNFETERAKFDDCVDFILADLELAEGLVPEKGQTGMGRINQDIVLALRARVTLLAASKLFNDPENPEGSIFRGKYDYEGKWDRAYKACKAMVERAEANGYALDDKYSEIWTDENSPELIWCKHFVATETDNKAQLFYPMELYAGWTSMEPVQALMIDYEMKNGKKFFEEGSGFDPKKPFANRDPRFYYSIVTPFSKFTTTTVEGTKEHDVQLYLYREDKVGADVSLYTGTYPGDWAKTPDVWSMTTWSGLELNKWYDPSKPITGDQTTTTHYPWFRLAEFYLNLAECAYMVGGKEQECRDYINKVRTRKDVMMPEVTESGEALWDRVVNERRIEFAFEFLRYFDVRRWKTAEFYENVPLCGMRTLIQKNTTTGQMDTVYRMARLAKDVAKTSNYYMMDATTDGLQGKTIQTYKWLGKTYEIDYGECIFHSMTSTAKIFDPTKNYLEPIPTNEIVKAQGCIVQNPGY